MGLESKGVQTKSDKSSKGSRRESASGGFSRVFGGGVSKSRSKESKNQNGRRTNLDKTGGSGVGHNKSPVIQYPTLPPRFSSPTGPYYAEKVNLPRVSSVSHPFHQSIDLGLFLVFWNSARVSMRAPQVRRKTALNEWKQGMWKQGM